MEYAIGTIFGLGIVLAAVMLGFDRDRSFYPTVLIVIAGYYVLFAAMGAGQEALLGELLVAIGFIVAAVIGFKTTQWVVAAALVYPATYFVTFSESESV